MRLALCEGEALRLCASCARNVELHPKPAGPDHRTGMHPNTRGERCLDWYPLPPNPKPATPAP